MELRALFRILWCRRWVALGVFAALFLTILAGTLLITPAYDATARVLIRRSGGAASVLTALGLSGSQASVNSVLSDTDRSDYLALAQVKPLVDSLIAKKPISGQRARGKVLALLPWLKPVLAALGVDVESATTNLSAEEVLKPSLLVKIFPKPYVEVEQYEATDLIDLTAYSPDPAQATELANALAAAFVDAEMARVQGDYRGAKAFIERNIVRAHDAYLESLAAIKDFKKRSVTLNVETETSNLLERVSDLKKQIADVEVGAAKMQATIRRIETSLLSIPKYQTTSEQVQFNEMIMNYKVALRDLHLALAETKTKYTEEHPVVLDLKNKIDTTRGLLQQEVERHFGSETKGVNATYQELSNRLSNSYADLAALESQEMTLPGILRRYEAEMMTYPDRASELSRAQLQLSVNEDLYNSLLKYQHLLELAETMALANISLVEPAISPLIKESRHRHPSLSINIVLGLLLGGVFGVCAAFLVEYLDTTVRSGADLAFFGKTPFLGAVSRVGAGATLVDEDEASPGLRESFHAVRTGIRLAALDRPLKTLVVTSPGRGEGKSFVAANVAATAAQEGLRVLIVDGHLGNPGVHAAFGLANDTGLSVHLATGFTLPEIVAATRVEGLQAITAGPPPRNPGRLAGSANMQRLLEAAKEQYDLVVVDSGPVLGASESRILASWADATLLVVAGGRTERAALAEALDLLGAAKATVIGVVIDGAAGPGWLARLGKK